MPTSQTIPYHLNVYLQQEAYSSIIDKVFGMPLSSKHSTDNSLCLRCRLIAPLCRLELVRDSHLRQGVAMTNMSGHLKSLKNTLKLENSRPWRKTYMCLPTACLAICKACRLPTLKDGLHKGSSSEPGYSEGKRQLRQAFHTLLHQFSF